MTIRNYGVILGQRPEDYIAGSSPIQYEERNPSGDWTAFLPEEERQYSRFADTMACVSFSALNCIEAQTKFLGDNKNYSDRALAKMSNTMPTGNYLWKVGDTIRNAGLVEEQYWRPPVDFTWETYYSDIPLPIRNSALEFLQKYDVKYEWLPDTAKETIKYHLKQSPIQVVIPGHAVMCFYSDAQVDKYFDTYEPFKKDYAVPFQVAMKYVVTHKSNPMNKTEVEALQLLEGYTDASGQAYWGDKVKPLSLYLVARIEDKIHQLQAVLAKLKAQ